MYSKHYSQDEHSLLELDVTIIIYAGLKNEAIKLQEKWFVSSFINDMTDIYAICNLNTQTEKKYIYQQDRVSVIKNFHPI